MKVQTESRVRLLAPMAGEQPDAVPVQTEGTVVMIDDALNVHVKWDNGSTLSLVPGDRYGVMDMMGRLHPPEVPCTNHCGHFAPHTPGDGQCNYCWERKNRASLFHCVTRHGMFCAC